MISGTAGVTNAGVGRELVHGLPPSLSTLSLVGEGNGVGMLRTATGGLAFGASLAEQATFIPTAPPLTIFALIVNRSDNAGLRHIVRSVGDTGSSWTFQMNYFSGQIGLTRWGIADQQSTTLGAVPNGGAVSSLGMTHDGTTVRFMLNGRFQSLASGGFNAASGAVLSQFMTDADNVALHVVYLWTRALTDAEMLLLDRDPWAPIRPRTRRTAGAASALTGMTRVSQVAAEVLQSPVAPLRVSQLVTEVLVPVVGATRVSQMLLEVLVADTTTGRFRASALAAEVLRDTDPAARVSALLAEVLRSPDAMLRVSALCAEVLRAPDPAVRFSALCAEILVAPAALSVPLTGQLFPRGSPLPFPYT